MPAPKSNKNAIGNKGGGRKSDFKKSFATMAYKLTMLGATDKDLADFFEVSETTINAWKKSHVEFSLALKKGKHIADAEVAMKLYKRANGYKYDEIHFEKIVLDANDETNIKTELYKKKVITKEVAPDVTAQIFWLKNRVKDKWRDRISNTIEFENFTDDQLDKIIETLLERSTKNTKNA